MQEHVIQLLRKHFILPLDVGAQTNLLFHGLNSLTLMHVVVELEAEFQIEVLDEELRVDQFSTVGKIVELLEGKGTKRGVLG